MNGTMRAMVLEGAGKLVLKQVPIPEIGPEDILFKVSYAAVCGTDLPAYSKLHYLTKLPIVIGHEFTGYVVEAGKDVKDIPVGMRFMGTNIEWCGICEACKSGNIFACPEIARNGLGLGRDGVFAEYSVLRKARLGLSVFPLPDGINDLTGAICEPMSVGVTSVNSIKPRDGERVVIYGAGIIGQSYIQAFRAACKCDIAVVDLSDLRLELAKKSGADITINPARDGSPYDLLGERWGYTDFMYHDATSRAGGNATIAVECTGSMSCVTQATEIVMRYGKVILAAGYGDEDVARIRPMTMMLKDARITAGWGGDFQSSIGYVASGTYKVDHLITHVYPLEQLDEAIHMAMDTAHSCKVCIKVDPQALDYL